MSILFNDIRNRSPKKNNGVYDKSGSSNYKSSPRNKNTNSSRKDNDTLGLTNKSSGLNRSPSRKNGDDIQGVELSVAMPQI